MMTRLRQRPALLIFSLALASCRGDSGAACTKDADCRSELVCHLASCVANAVKLQAEEKARIGVRNERARSFLKQKFKMSDREAAQLSFSGQRLVIAHSQTNMEFCLEPETVDGRAFKVLFVGTSMTKLCGGQADNQLSFGDVVGAGGL